MSNDDFKDFVSKLQCELYNTSPTSLRFLLVSTHINQVTGYSKVGYGLIHALSKLPWLELHHFAIQNMGPKSPNSRIYPSNVKVFDVVTNEKEQQMGFGFKELPEYVKKINPHIIMIYNDASIISNYCEELRKSFSSRSFKIWIYFDQVYTFHTSQFIDTINKNVDRVFCFTNEWKKVAKQLGIVRPLDVIPHAFESNLFYPISKEVARQALKLPIDSFVFLNMNRNQPRKRLDILIMAFVQLLIKYPQMPIYLMCVTDAGTKGGFPLFEIFSRELELHGVPPETFSSRLLVTSNDMSFKDYEINIMYNAADVGVSTAEGEGFGLCAFEQMGVGIPQVLSDVVGHREYTTSNNSIVVPCKTRNYLPNVYTPMGGESNLVDYRDFAIGMEKYLNNRGLIEAHGKAARELVLTYTWERCLSTFVKRLEACHKQLVEEGEIN